MIEKTYSFDSMPTTLADIVKKLESIEMKVSNLSALPKEEKILWLNLKELCQYLPNHPAEQTVYGWTSAHSIPFHKKGKSIVFLKSEVDEWLCNGKQKSIMDIEMDALSFVSEKNKSKNSYL